MHFSITSSMMIIS